MNKSYLALALAILLVIYSSFIIIQKTCNVDRFLSYLPSGIGTQYTYDPESGNSQYDLNNNTMAKNTSKTTNSDASIPENLQEVRGNNIRWQVPEKTKDIVITLQESNGSFIREIIITNYITIKPGQKVKLQARQND